MVDPCPQLIVSPAWPWSHPNLFLELSLQAIHVSPAANSILKNLENGAKLQIHSSRQERKLRGSKTLWVGSPEKVQWGLCEEHCTRTFCV